MNKSHVQDATTRKLVERFRDYVFWLKVMRYTYRELFEVDDAEVLTKKTAPYFFFDLSNILADYWLLAVAKLTDPATSSRGAENFTIANLMETVDWPTECLEEIEKLNDTIQSFRGYIEQARNKLLAHLDKKTFVSGISFGGFPAGEDEKLLVALEKMCNVFYEAAFGEISGNMAPYDQGDVQDLKKALTRAIAFEELFSNSQGEEKSRLWNLIKQVGAGTVKEN